MLTFSQLSNAALPVACVVLGAFLALRGLAYWASPPVIKAIALTYFSSGGGTGMSRGSDGVCPGCSPGLGPV
jgi:hypothetical protein